MPPMIMAVAPAIIHPTGPSPIRHAAATLPPAMIALAPALKNDAPTLPAEATMLKPPLPIEAMPPLIILKKEAALGKPKAND
ncbi:hypothetical protein SDC9_212359 [bioreactor metagenome]|uniref:Uncharacterized protein n=1 Tax=bioreactor metagenome TaxID=1076179 RepID=A0A645K067_9ZZZZ